MVRPVSFSSLRHQSVFGFPPGQGGSFARAAAVLGLVVILLGMSPADAQESETDRLPTIAEKTEDMDTIDGFVPLYWDAREGSLWMEVSRFSQPFLHYTTLVSGLGSNPVGLDRGQTGSERIVHFERTGTKVFLVEPNLEYRADTDNPAEKRAVQEAFAPSVVWGFEVAAERKEGDAVLVEATDFVVRDAHGIVNRLKETDQGAYELDKSRSAPHLDNVMGFPRNTEMEARLTFTTDDPEPGEYVRQTAADPTAVTLRVRQSFAELPDTSEYTPRSFDPRSGFYSEHYQDYATPVGESMDRRFIRRHRLSCAEPPGDDGVCPVEEPIVYYLDPGTPEPVRSALLDGARWWKEAFREAGFENAYRVEMLPEDAHPADIRYNVIEWVHRRTRGWSYGSSVADPRTGEILKADVALGSRRVRQDYLLAEGLLAPYEGEYAEGYPADEDPMLAMALARLRQLSAHEVGHTLGLRHNFAASATPNERSSVMDYPAPLARIEGDSLSLHDAYDTGVASWDVLAIRYGYEPLSQARSEDALLERLLQKQADQNINYITDQDARPAGAAHPQAHLWDNGSDPVEALDREMEVRTFALDRFGEEVLKMGDPLAVMEETLVPLYLRHRYQVTATSKLLGGVAYDYAVRGEEEARVIDRVPADQQEEALDALLKTIRPSTLALPDAVRKGLPPRPPGHPANRELFDGYTAPTFDTYAPAEVAATMVLEALVQPERAMRMIGQHDTNPDLPSLRSVLTQTTDRVWKQSMPNEAYHAELQRTTQQVWTDVLLSRAEGTDVAPAVQARLTEHLRALSTWLNANGGRDAETQAHRRTIQASIQRFLERDKATASPPPSVETPPGSPIGDWAPDYVRRQEQRRKQLELSSPALPACFR